MRGTPLGRWFLAEFARRNRAPEIQMLLDAMARLETAVLKPQRHVALTSVLSELGDMSEAIARTRREIASLKPPHRFDKQLTDVSGELDLIVEATEAATSEILSAAEDVQEIAWTLREKGVAVEFCDRLDHRAIDIYTACSFQDITGQRTDKVVRALRFIEQRVNAMIKIWGVDDIASRIGGISAEMERLAQEETDLLDGPQAEGEGLKQDEVDQMMGSAPPGDAPEAERFERPEPLTLDKLHGVKRSALFG
ncbi:MAG: hypothetical protein R3D01_14240 [Hyphomicrobiales bacterium]